MKAQAKAIVASMVVIALALAAVSGVTYSWFSDTESSDINVSTAKIDIKGEFTSATVDTNPGNLKDGDTKASYSGNELIISNLLDNKVITSSYHMTNNSTVDTKYRMYVSIDGDLPYGITLNVSCTSDAPMGVTTDLSFTNGIAYILGDEENGVNLSAGPKLYIFTFTLETEGFFSEFDSTIKVISEAYQTDYTYTAPQILNSAGEVKIPASVTGDVTFKGTAPASETGAQASEIEMVFSDGAVNTAMAGVEGDVTLSAKMLAPADDVARIELSLTGAGVNTSFGADNYVTVSVNVPGQYNGVDVVYDGAGDPPILLSCSYDDGTMTTKITFKTNHFSEFKITAKEQSITIDSSESLVNAIMNNAERITIFLKENDDPYVTNVTVPAGKDVTIIGKGDKSKIVLSGQIANLSSGNLIIKNVSVNVDSTINDATNISQTGASAIALWGDVEFFAYDVVFNMSLEGSTAITTWWSTGDGANITVKNCVFNCNGQRPIRSDASVTVDGCTFNDPYRYAVQLTSIAGTATKAEKGIINFYNNIINNGAAGKTFVYGVQLEGADYGCQNLIINGSGNTINTGEWDTDNKSTMYYCECGLNHCEFNKDGEIVSIIWNTEVSPTHESGIAIYNSEDLRTLATMVNDGNNLQKTTVLLVNDIDLNNEEWTPIGKSGRPFSGIFDGNGKTISNLKITGSRSDVGLFGFTTNGEIKNIVINNASVSGYLDVGALAGTPYTSKYSNITLKGHVEINGYAYVGGLGGKNAYADWTDITIDCDDTSYVKADSKYYRTYVGGVIGFMGEGSHTLKNVTSNIDVTGSTCDVGGIVGIAHYNNTFINCTSSGDVKITNAVDAGDDEEIGGIAGVWHNENGTTVTFTDCYYTGRLTSNLGADLSDNNITGRQYSADGEGTLVINYTGGESGEVTV